MSYSTVAFPPQLQGAVRVPIGKGGMTKPHCARRIEGLAIELAEQRDGVALKVRASSSRRVHPSLEAK
jgi:hypothetical protein